MISVYKRYERWSQMLDCKLHSNIPSPLLQELPELPLCLRLEEPRVMRDRYPSAVEVASPQPKQAALHPQLFAEHARPQKLAFVRAELAFCCSCYPQHWEDTKTVTNFNIFSKVHTFLIGAAADHTQPDIPQAFFLLLPLPGNTGSDNPQILHLILEQSGCGFEYFPTMIEINMSIEYTEIEQFRDFYFELVNVGMNRRDKLESTGVGRNIDEEFYIPIVSLLHGVQKQISKLFQVLFTHAENKQELRPSVIKQII